MQANAIRKRALLAGGAWTLAVAAAPALFKSSPVAPIYLSTVGLLALGWMGILLHALAAERRAADASMAAAGCDTRGVVGQKLGHVRRELEAVGQTMQRVRELYVAAAEPAPCRTCASEQAGLAARVKHLLRELQEARGVSPVRQELMHAGEVDLF